jgi:hypothetical protein
MSSNLNDTIKRKKLHDPNFTPPIPAIKKAKEKQSMKPSLDLSKLKSPDITPIKKLPPKVANNIDASQRTDDK